MDKNKTFIDKVLSGEAKVEDVDDAIDEWHNSDDSRTLADFLGIPDEWEYTEFLLYAEEGLKKIINRRK
jgi:hypothetical protein